MVHQAAVCTNFLPKTTTSARYVVGLTKNIYHYTLRWARQIIEVKTFGC